MTIDGSPWKGEQPNGARWAEVCGLYERVFAGREDRIPLIVTPKYEPGASRRELVEDTERAVGRMAQSLAPKVQARTDWLPTVCIAWFQYIAIPSAFGAEPNPLEGELPSIRPIFRSIDEALDAGMPELDTPVIEHMDEVLDQAVRAIPEGFALSFPATMSPMDLAQMLMPCDEFLASAMTVPEKCEAFLHNLTAMWN